MTGINVGGHGSLPTPPPTADLFGGKAGVDTTSDLYTVDSADGTLTSVGASGYAITGLAFRPSDSVLFGATSSNSAADPWSLITVDPVTGAGTLVGAFNITVPFGSGITDITFRSDDTLFGYGNATHRLYTIDQATGAATEVSSTQAGTPFAGGGLAFDSTDTLFLFSKRDDGIFYIVDDSTGGLTAQPTLTGSPEAGGAISAASFDAADLCWVVSIGGTNTWVDTIDVGAATVAGVGITDRTLDGLAWRP